jgi:hypothetical protein
MEPSTIGESIATRGPPAFSAASRLIWGVDAAMPGMEGAPADVDWDPGLAFSW